MAYSVNLSLSVSKLIKVDFAKTAENRDPESCSVRSSAVGRVTDRFQPQMRSRSPVSYGMRDYPTLSSSDCCEVWEEVKKNNKISLLGKSFMKTTQELSTRLTDDSLSEKEKSAIVNFLCESGVINVNMTTAVQCGSEDKTDLEERVSSNSREENGLPCGGGEARAELSEGVSGGPGSSSVSDGPRASNGGSGTSRITNVHDGPRPRDSNSDAIGEIDFSAITVKVEREDDMACDRDQISCQIITKIKEEIEDSDDTGDLWVCTSTGKCAETLDLVSGQELPDSGVSRMAVCESSGSRGSPEPGVDGGEKDSGMEQGNTVNGTEGSVKHEGRHHDNILSTLMSLRDSPVPEVIFVQGYTPTDAARSENPEKSNRSQKNGDGRNDEGTGGAVSRSTATGDGRTDKPQTTDGGDSADDIHEIYVNFGMGADRQAEGDSGEIDRRDKDGGADSKKAKTSDGSNDDDDGDDDDDDGDDDDDDDDNEEEDEDCDDSDDSDYDVVADLDGYDDTSDFDDYIDIGFDPINAQNMDSESSCSASVADKTEEGAVSGDGSATDPIKKMFEVTKSATEQIRNIFEVQSSVGETNKTPEKKPVFDLVNDYSNNYRARTRGSNWVNPPGNKFECKLCGKKLRTIAILKKHMKRHAGIKRCQCDQCGKRFDDSYALRVHKRIHTGEKPFECSYCSQRFMNKHELVIHVRRHTGERPYKCNVCEKGFRDNKNLVLHMRIHTGERPYVCKVCDMSFCQSSNLRGHMRMHTGEKPFSCDLCDMKFTRPYNVVLHKRVHTGEKPYSCPYCIKKCSQKSQLSQHINIIHLRKKPFTCDQCGKSFSCSSNYKSHLNVHLYNEGPFDCPDCGKSFRQKQYLANHVRVHKGRRPFMCRLCGNRFKHKARLDKHMRKHADIKPFKCSVCGKRYGLDSQLECHMKVHGITSLENVTDSVTYVENGMDPVISEEHVTDAVLSEENDTDSVISEENVTDSVTYVENSMDPVISEENVTDAVLSEENVTDSVIPEENVTDSVTSMENVTDSATNMTAV